MIADSRAASSNWSVSEIRPMSTACIRCELAWDCASSPWRDVSKVNRISAFAYATVASRSPCCALAVTEARILSPVLSARRSKPASNTELISLLRQSAVTRAIPPSSLRIGG
jgi:hypothetical protein